MILRRRVALRALLLVHENEIVANAVMKCRGIRQFCGAFWPPRRKDLIKEPKESS
jgi:hypothetical protein